MLSKTHEYSDKMKEQLSRLITELGRLMESGGDPLDLDVNQKLTRLAELIDESTDFAHIELDTEALYRLALLIYAQSKSLRDKSSILYIDPFLIRLALIGASPDRLAQALLRAWTPVAYRDVINPQMMRNSFAYWSSLRKYEMEKRSSEILSGQDLKSMGVSYEVLMTNEIEDLHDELKRRGERVLYEELVGKGNLSERLRKAILISFMLSYGYATIVKDPLRRKIWVVAAEGKAQETTREKESLVMIVK